MRLAWLSYQTFFLEGTNGLCADLQLDLLTINHDSLSLEVWLPDFLCVALREADIVAKLLAFTGEFTLLHKLSFDSSGYCT
jgi:hypothetical protein